jgi:dephospho-CoA kinase
MVDSGKPIIGILGGICSGKSTVASEFSKFGCAVIDADSMAKQLLDEPEIQAQITELFGSQILDNSGRVDRQKVAGIVFSDESKLSELTKIIHPLVLEKTNTLIDAYRNNTGIKAIVLDMPLLAEIGWERRCDKLIFVDCDSEIRLVRAKNRGFSGENELKMRENFQISLDKKARMSDYIVHNNSDLSELALQVSRIFNYIVSGV